MDDDGRTVTDRSNSPQSKLCRAENLLHTLPYPRLSSCHRPPAAASPTLPRLLQPSLTFSHLSSPSPTLPHLLPTLISLLRVKTPITAACIKRTHQQLKTRLNPPSYHICQHTRNVFRRSFPFRALLTAPVFYQPSEHDARFPLMQT